jgi:hypothetical protein
MECNKVQKTVENFNTINRWVNDYDKMKSCHNCNVNFTQSTQFITCAEKCYCSKECQNAYQTKNKKEHDRKKFVTILMYQLCRYDYITKSPTNDIEIVDQFNKAIQDIKSDKTQINKSLIEPIMAQNFMSSREHKNTIEKLVKEYDEGRRTIEDPNIYNSI